MKSSNLGMTIETIKSQNKKNTHVPDNIVEDKETDTSTDTDTSQSKLNCIKGAILAFILTSISAAIGVTYFILV